MRIVFTALICLLTFASELVLDGSTAFVRAQANETVGQLVLNAENPYHSNDLPQDSPPAVPNWAKAPAPAHVAGAAESIEIGFSLLTFTAPLFQIPGYQEPHPPLFHRPPIV